MPGWDFEAAKNHARNEWAKVINQSEQNVYDHDTLLKIPCAHSDLQSECL